MPMDWPLGGVCVEVCEEWEVNERVLCCACGKGEQRHRGAKVLLLHFSSLKMDAMIKGSQHGRACRTCTALPRAFTSGLHVRRIGGRLLLLGRCCSRAERGAEFANRTRSCACEGDSPTDERDRRERSEMRV